MFFIAYLRNIFYISWSDENQNKFKLLVQRAVIAFLCNLYTCGRATEDTSSSINPVKSFGWAFLQEDGVQLSPLLLWTPVSNNQYNPFITYSTKHLWEDWEPAQQSSFSQLSFDSVRWRMPSQSKLLLQPISS